jgi:hypothetical protein
MTSKWGHVNSLNSSKARSALFFLCSWALPPTVKAAGRRALGYYDQAVQSRRGPLSKPSWCELARSFPPWWRSFQADEEISRQCLPWLTFPAVSFLKRSLRPHWRVFEFGSGASTVFFALRCRKVFSIEHDAGWATKVCSALDALGISNCRLRHIAPERNQPRTVTDCPPYGSQFDGYEDCTFESYVRSIDDHADGSLDLVLVDGRAREACLWHAIHKVRPGGILVLDNTERPRYHHAMSKIPSHWRRMEFPGPCAGADFFTKTTVWVAADSLRANESYGSKR